MLQKKIMLVNKLGLHARAAMKLVNTANQFESDISVRYRDRTVNARHIMELMALAATCNTELEIITNGTDETNAMEALTQLIQNKFGEEKNS